MNTATIEMPKLDAHKLYQQYRRQINILTLDDIAIMKAANLILRGKKIIDLAKSIEDAGRYPSGLPKLAVARAHWLKIRCDADQNGVLRFDDVIWNSQPEIRIKTQTTLSASIRGEAVTPLIPPQLRPRENQLRRYHILWEAEWERVPVDPMLLRRIEKSNLYVVLATWNLSELEQAVLRQRL